jgi:glycosyltransferase involved in cell wall biosynthesis
MGCIGEDGEMRVGQNPAKSLKEVEKPAEITVAITTYIPFLSGYYEQSLDVLKLSLESLIAHSDLPYDLMIFDNGSCAKVREYLFEMQQVGRIQYLILSEKNVGVVGAWNVIFGAAPGKYIAYSDYDIYFYPNWLSALIEVVEIFPQAGMVTGMPLLTPVQFSSNTIEWAEKTPNVEFESGLVISWENVWRHGQSIGISKEEGKKFFEDTPSYEIRFQDKRCYIGAGHFQFVGRKEYFQKIVPLYAERPMGGEVRNLDIAINGHGYLRLNTPEWNVEHMGNTVLEKYILQEGPRSALLEVKSRVSVPGNWITRIAIVRRILESLYNRIFRILFGG